MAEQNFTRQYDDPQETLFPSPLILDRHRIIHSTAFRRLGYKTQVFVPFEADHFRTRLTHSVEVAHLAKLIARKFNANTLLAEIIGLAHDLGHSPFGHTGEQVLNKLLKDEGGFEHNQQSLRIVQYLERPFPWFVGLNLTEATLKGLELHSTPYDRQDTNMPQNSVMLEAQIANWADRIAYDVSDIEDAFGAGFIRNEDMLSIELYNRVRNELDTDIKSLPIYKIRRVICERLQMKIINALIIDDKGIIGLSTGFLEQIQKLEQFLLQNVYLHDKLQDISKLIEQIITRLFMHYLNNPNLLPERYLARNEIDSLPRIISDYISGMTDRFCLKTYQQFFGRNALSKQLCFCIFGLNK